METDKLDQLFASYQVSTPQVSFEETRKQFLRNTDRSNGTTSAGDGFNFLKLFIMITTFGAIALMTNLIFSNPTATYQPRQTVQNLPNHEANSEQFSLIDSAAKQLEMPTKSQPENPVQQAQTSVSTDTAAKPIRIVQQRRSPNRSYFPPFYQPIKSRPVTSSVKNIPTLTEDQIKATLKQKAKMIKALRKRDKSVYRELALKGNKQLDSSTFAQYTYYIQTTEVSVLEYRTFLHDLLIQGQNDRYVIAKPDANAWNPTSSKTSYMEPMVQNYFSHPAYNNYPINCISREGAQLYCEWLTEEVVKWKVAKGKPVNPDYNWILKLPTEREWMIAASSKHDSAAYPWNGPYLRNSKGEYLANFRPKKDDYQEDGALFTSPVESYFPNEYGLFCMSGNIAEMITYDDVEKTPGTKGGSWSSIAQEIQIHGNDRFKGVTQPSADIGFRPVIYLEISDAVFKRQREHSQYKKGE